MTLAEMLMAAEKASEGIEINNNTEFKPIPPGTYKVRVENAEGPVDSKRANPTNPSEFGKIIKIMFSIIEGEYAGRKLFMNNNIIVYPKSLSADDVKRAQQAMALGGQERKVLLASVGKVGIENAAELIGAICTAKTRITKDINGKDRAEIARLMPDGDFNVVAPTVTGSPSHTEAAPTTRAKLPWEM